MKKYFKAIFVSLIIGFFLSYFFLTQYKDFKGITVSNEGDEYYFLTNGKYSTSKDILDKISFVNPIVDKILEYRMLSKLYSNYAVGLVRRMRKLAEYAGFECNY